MKKAGGEEQVSIIRRQGCRGREREGTVVIRGQQERSLWTELFCVTTAGGTQKLPCVTELRQTDR